MELIGREYQARQLRQYIERGMSCQVIGPAGSGKTTLIQAVTRNLVESFPKKYSVTWLTTQNYTSEIAFWKALWIGCRGSEVVPGIPSDLVRILEESYHLGLITVVCLDDVDNIAEQDGSLSPDFFYELRNLATQAKVIFIASARQNLSQLLPSSRIGSTFFSYFALLQLGAISVDDLIDLIRKENIFLSTEDEVALRVYKAYHPAEVYEIVNRFRTEKNSD